MAEDCQHLVSRNTYIRTFCRTGNAPLFPLGLYSCPSRIVEGLEEVLQPRRAGLHRFQSTLSAAAHNEATKRCRCIAKQTF